MDHETMLYILAIFLFICGIIIGRNTGKNESSQIVDETLEKHEIAISKSTDKLIEANSIIISTIEKMPPTKLDKLIEASITWDSVDTGSSELRVACPNITIRFAE
jgi:hypothetical protein